MIPFKANYIETVHPLLSDNSGLCTHSIGGITFLEANNIATVIPLNQRILGL